MTPNSKEDTLESKKIEEKVVVMNHIREVQEDLVREVDLLVKEVNQEANLQERVQDLLLLVKEVHQEANLQEKKASPQEKNQSLQRDHLLQHVKGHQLPHEKRKNILRSQ